MIRKFLQDEGRRLLEDFDAPDFRTLWRRAIFYGFIWTGTAAVCFGLVWLRDVAGIEAMSIAAVAIIVLAIWMERRMPVYYSGDWDWLGGEPPALPPPGKQTLPPPGIPRLPSPGMRAISDNRSHTRR